MKKKRQYDSLVELVSIVEILATANNESMLEVWQDNDRIIRSF